jgi:hypothetical protein
LVVLIYTEDKPELHTFLVAQYFHTLSVGIDRLSLGFLPVQLGLNNPTTLLHTIWFFNTIFGMRGVTEHYDMKWGDIKLCTDSNNLKYLEMNEAIIFINVPSLFIPTLCDLNHFGDFCKFVFS